MPNYKNAFPSKYLKADDISTPRAVEIKSVDFEDVGAAQRQERKLVVHFVELAKPLVLNLINADTIAEISGTNDYEQWPGTTIEPTRRRRSSRGSACPVFALVSRPAGPPLGRPLTRCQTG